ncbi:expressed unknown protein [Seminavis robusta]|uniref:Uncharacterized protein n=1 Tax=Seminavis robusta TaxID=568900 RepID=A0A9N8HCB5_9STRA|nr:expressed unknown protein [Seminavis robusta]|eukprot:Sro213_g088420.1 n/a (602) ;mRNA; r:37409-39306
MFQSSPSTIRERSLTVLDNSVFVVADPQQPPIISGDEAKHQMLSKNAKQRKLYAEAKVKAAQQRHDRKNKQQPKGSTTRVRTSAVPLSQQLSGSNDSAEQRSKENNAIHNSHETGYEEDELRREGEQSRKQETITELVKQMKRGQQQDMKAPEKLKGNKEDESQSKLRNSSKRQHKNKYERQGDQNMQQVDMKQNKQNEAMKQSTHENRGQKQQQQGERPGKREAIDEKPQGDNVIPKDSQIVVQKIPTIKERIITFVHVGKAGGMSLRDKLSLICRLPLDHGQTPNEIRRCIDKKHPNKRDLLGRQTQYYFHMWSYRQSYFRKSTSFLFVLRSPVDRVLSAYRYAHPANCYDDRSVYKESPLPHGCSLGDRLKKRPKGPTGVFFKFCFPYAAAEEFAQSVMSPWKADPTHPNTTVPSSLATKSRREQMDCRKKARGAADGTFKTDSFHLEFNYRYYASSTAYAFPGKEVLAIRTENQWEDIQHLANNYLGGNTTFNNTKAVSHGSEKYHPSPITQEAYRKLCFVLEGEIEIYLDLLNRAQNLSEGAKKETDWNLREKCGVKLGWIEWKRHCKIKLQGDEKRLGIVPVATSNSKPNYSGVA